jgi:hypothetical protein
MTRALAGFTVTHKNWKLKVRVLMSIDAVDNLFHGGRARRSRNLVVHAFWSPPPQTALRCCLGCITLPDAPGLAEYIPHEVTHAVMDRLRFVSALDDEAAATAIGALSARIARRCARLGIEVR